MTTPTELELQLFLANQLPEEIEILEQEYGTDEYRFSWKEGRRLDGSEPVVTSREWDCIVRRVEEKLSHQESYTFRQRLWDLTESHGPQEFGGINGEAHNRRYASAPWPTRTIALMKLKGEI